MDSFRSITAPREVALRKSLPGYRFSPTGEEIIDYLEKKRLDPDNFCVDMIQELDIYSYEPWDLAGTKSEVYIFSEPRSKGENGKPRPKGKNGKLFHRKTTKGCWKINGKGSKVNRIGRKRTLSFRRGQSNTEWAMHEFYITEEDSRYKKDFVLCVVRKKRKWDKKRGVSTNEGQSNQKLVPCSGQPLPENTISKTVPVKQPSNNLVSNRKQTTEDIFLKTQLPPSNPPISYYRNQGEENHILYSQQVSGDTMISSSRNVAGNDSPEPQQQLPYHNMIPYDQNHVANGYPASQQQQQLPNQDMIPSHGKRVVGSGSLQLQPLANHNMFSYPRNYILQNACGESQQLIPDHNLISNGNHVAVGASPESQQLMPNENLELPNFELVQLRNQNLDFGFMNIITENTSAAHPLLLEEFHIGRSCSGLNNASSSTLQSPVYSEQGSSYSNCSNSGGDSLNSQFGSGQVNYLISSRRDFQNEYSGQETGGTPIPHFNSSKPDRGVYVTDINDMDTEARVNELPEDDISDMDIDAQLNELARFMGNACSKECLPTARYPTSSIRERYDKEEYEMLGIDFVPFNSTWYVPPINYIELLREGICC